MDRENGGGRGGRGCGGYWRWHCTGEETWLFPYVNHGASHRRPRRMFSIIRSNFRLSKLPLRIRPFACSQSLFSKRSKHWNTQSMQQTVESILVLGAGSFGLCLADHLGDSEHHVYLWSRSKDFCDHFNQHYRSIHQLTDHQFSTHITAVGPEFPNRALVNKIDVLLFAIPTEGIRCVHVQCVIMRAGWPTARYKGRTWLH